MTKILLIRHGQTDGNLARRVQGQTNTPLNTTGHAQAEALSVKMATRHPDLTAIYSSDLDRAHQTALKTAQKLALPVATHPHFRERHFGSAEGMLVSELIALYGEPHWVDAPIDGSESRAEMLLRFTTTLAACATQHEGKKIAIFTHGLAIRTMIIEYSPKSELPFLNNCDVASFSWNRATGLFLFEEIEQ